MTLYQFSQNPKLNKFVGSSHSNDDDRFNLLLIRNPYRLKEVKKKWRNWILTDSKIACRRWFHFIFLLHMTMG